MALFASLPMYDWPEVQSSTDAYWLAIRKSFLEQGIFADDLAPSLARSGDPRVDWLHPDLVISQTCGLPYVRDLQGKVTLLGAPVFDIDSDPGNYFSFIIANIDNEAFTSDRLASGRLAYNDLRSQSGYAAYMGYLLEVGEKRFSGELVHTGSHRSSIKRVAERKADFAAIDAITFRLAERFEPAVKSVKIIAKTKTTPSLPYITSLRFEAQRDMMNTALAQAVDRLPPAIREDLFLEGYIPLMQEDYRVVQRRWKALEEAGFVHS